MRISAQKFWLEHDQWRDGMFNHLPPMWRKSVQRKYFALKKQSLKKANLYLIDLIEPIQGSIDIAADDGELQDLAKVCASDCSDYLGQKHATNNLFDAHDQCLKMCNKYAVDYPMAFDLLGQAARLIDGTWWLRKLRNSHAKAREAAARDAGIVHKKHDVYVSDDTLERRTQQRKRNAKLLEGITMRSAHGELMKLADIAAAGMANQANRHNELMTRVSGFEALAKKFNHKALFVTLTTPSRMHATLSTGASNPKYDGTKPDNAQKYLVHCWAKARALLKFYDIKIYGLWVAEPHHDGTPHWHLILFYDGKPSTKVAIKRCITDKFVEADKFELGRDITPRVKYVEIDPKRGSAAGYVMKYIAKNIGGIKDENSDEATGQTSEGMAARVEAWASTWRIRQFQQVGGHYVSVWREFRRVDECMLEGKTLQFVKAWQACQRQGDTKASFSDYLQAMGGVDISPKEGAYCIDKDAVERQGKYGRVSVLKTIGVGERYGVQFARTNRVEWVRV